MKLQGCPARICMPITAAPIKVEAVKRLGGIIDLVGETYAEAQTYAQVSQNLDTQEARINIQVIANPPTYKEPQTILICTCCLVAVPL